MTGDARILLVSDADLEARVRSALPELNGNLRRWKASPQDVYVRNQLADVVAVGPDIVAFGPDLPVDSMLELAAELDRLNPEIEVVLFAPPSPELWERAARSGVRDAVLPSAGGEELAATFRRTMTMIAGRRAAERPSAAPDGSHHALAIVRSPKGGSGKTMVSTNLATALAKRHPGEVVLVDLDLQFGDMATALGVEPTYTIADATANAELTATGLKALLSTHKSSLYTLCAPPHPDEAGVITGDDVAAVLTLLQEAFRFVIVDTAAGTDAHVSAALHKATDIVFVCSMDVSSVRALRKDLESIDGADLSRTKQHVVLNRADSRVALDVRDIEETIGRTVDVRIPSSRLVPLHMNCGVPVTEAEPTSPVAKQLGELVNRLSPVPATASKRRGRRR